MGFYDARRPQADHDPTQQIQWQIANLVQNINPFSIVRSILTFTSDFIRQFPVLGDLVSPFLDAIADLIKLENPTPETMIQFLTDPVGWAKRILSFVIAYVRMWPILGDLIAPFLDAIQDLIDDAPDTMVEFLTNPIAWAKRILRFMLGFLRGVPVLGEFIAPFLDAIEDLIDDIPDTMMDFLDPIKWAKIFLKFSSQFIRGFPVLGDLIAPFLDAVDQLVEGIPDEMLGILNPATWLQWILNAFLSEMGIDFSWLAGLTGFNLGGNNFFTGIMSLLGNPAGLLSGDISGLGGMALGAMPLFGPLLSGFAIGGLPFNVSNLFGTLPPSLFGFVPIGALSNETVNLLPQGMFPPGSIAPGDGWEIDAGKTATTDSTGSGKHAADGKNHALRSIPIVVAPGKQLNLSIKAWWQSLVSTGTPIQLWILKFKNDIEVGRESITSIAASGTSSSWTTLSGTYTAPADGSVDMIKLRPRLGSSATSGTVWFDDAIIELPGEIEQEWVTNLIPQFEGVLDLFGLSSLLDLIGLDPSGVWATLITGPLNAFMTVWNKLYDVFGGVTGSAGKTLTNVLTIGKSFFDTIAGTTGATFTQLTNRMTELFQLLQTLAGVIITPVSSLVTDAVTRLQYIGTDGILSSTGIPALAQSKITNLVNDLTDRLRISGTNGSDDYFTRLRGIFQGGGPVSTTASTLSSSFSALMTEVIDLPFSMSNTTARGIYNNQTTSIVANIAISPYDSIIQNIKNWWDAETWAWWS